MVILIKILITNLQAGLYLLSVYDGVMKQKKLLLISRIVI
jgi:hypothetical protein